MVMGLAALLAAVVAWILLASTPWRLRMKSQSSDAYLDVLLSVLRQPPFPLADGDSRSIERDIQTIMVRVANEGISFLTKTLPAFGKRVLLSVEEGMLVDFPGFATMKSQPHPAFLQVVTTRLFDSEGRLRTDADPLAMKHLEQVVFMFYKLGLPHTEHESQNVINGFVQVDDQLAGLTLPDDEIFVVAKSLVRSVVQGYNPDIFRPRHGPGAVATGERLDDKWFFGTIYGQLEKSFPYIRCFTAMDPAGGKADFDILSRVKPALNGCAKVVLVPKDSRGPRLISAEPLAYQWVQQAVSSQLTSLIESNELTMGHVNFVDQSINGDLALMSSMDGRLATLDLKEASDRVSLALVEKLFPEPILTHLKASRSLSTQLPDGSVLPLRKFAPMGSALCFPVLSLTVYALCVAARVVHRGITMRQAIDTIFVFGDDLVVSADDYEVTVAALERAGLMVNASKSYRRGPYRESCGVNAFKGVVTTPVRFRTVWTGRSSDASALASWVAYGNALWSRGYTVAATRVFSLVESSYGFIPYGVDASGFPCKVIESHAVAHVLNTELGVRTRWNPRYQRHEYRVLRVIAEQRESWAVEYQRLLKALIMPPQSQDPSQVVLPRSTRIKRGWAPL